MKILAIETSCDDTGIAILEVSEAGYFKVLSNIVSSQTKVHKKYGGVYPFLAKREHEKNLPIVLEKALKEAKNPKIDLIAVTNGPGLEPCLWVGVNFAKELAQKLGVPLVPVNHIEAHILINFLQNRKINFPVVALVVSGGHTQLILMKKIGKYKILGETRDDAAGECLDKCAKILGLGYPGGPAIAAAAAKSEIRNPKSEIKLPRPMINTKDYDFSFSGLKTAVLYAWQKIKVSIKVDDRQLWRQAQIQMAAEVQQAVIDVLIKKTMKAVKDYGVKIIILGGGVSANSELRKQFAEAIKKEKIKRCFLSRGKKQRINSKLEIKLLVPEPKLSTDNGLMVAVAGYFRRKQKIATSDVAKLQADANLRISK